MRSFCLVVDYSQNLGLSHFREEQPSDMYYFSPLSVFVFGVVIFSYTPEKSFAYYYTEDMDNCSGQNKNNHVSRLSLLLVERKHFQEIELLVERKHFQEIEFIFYILGHTKNVCNRMFNLQEEVPPQSSLYAKVCFNIVMYYTLQKECTRLAK
jgi:hypothetical protein